MAETRPDPAAVREALGRVVTTTLQGAPQLARFLTFVVEETLAGRGGQLKEYTIAIGAFAQPVGFDPSSDARVRVAARQLRFKLDEYYRSTGAEDPVLIVLPKGRYVPVFTPRAPAPAPVGSEEGVTAPPPSPRRVRSWFVMAALLVVAIAARVAWPPRASGPASAAPSARTPRAAPIAAAGPVIAVLPFANITGRTTDDFIGDGLAEEIASRLAMDSTARVIARTSAWTFRGRAVDAREAGRVLGAAYLVEGSVRRSQDRYRVSVALSTTSDGVRAWSRQYDVEQQSVFGLYDTIAQAVHEELAVRMGRPPMNWPTRHAPRGAANATYLEGRFFWNQRTPDALQRALGLLRTAVREDSTFALGWAALGGVLATMEINHVTEPGVSGPQAIAAARRALALDPSLGEAWTAIGLVAGFSEWRWQEADDAFRRAIALSPNYATARSWYSNTLLARGRIDEALEQLERARALDPLSAPIAYGISQAQYYGRRWDDGLRSIERTVAMNPGNPFPLLLKGKLLKGAGRLDEARAVFSQLGDSLELALLADPATRQRNVPRLLARIPAAEQRKSQFWIATFWAQLGEADSAFAWIDRAYRAHQPDLVSIRTDPMIDPVKSDPRYQAVVARIGLGDDATDGPRTITPRH